MATAGNPDSPPCSVDWQVFVIFPACSPCGHQVLRPCDLWIVSVHHVAESILRNPGPRGELLFASRWQARAIAADLRARGRQVDKAEVPGDDDRGQSPVDAEQAADGVDLVLDRPVRPVELSGHLLALKPAGQQREHPDVLGGQPEP